MRINIYTEELTDETELVEKTAANTGITYYGARLFVRSPEELHHTPQDDDRSAVTLWIPWTAQQGHDGKYVADILRELADRCEAIQGHGPFPS